MTEQIFHVGIKALIVNDKDEILLLKSGPAEQKHTNICFWDIPGGRIKTGHKINDTLKREVKEELGIDGNDIEIGSIFGATISNFKASHGDGIALMLIVYRCGLKSEKDLILSDEHSEWKWFSVAEAKKLLAVKYPKDFIDKLDDIIMLTILYKDRENIP